MAINNLNSMDYSDHISESDKAATSLPCYKNSMEHLLDEMERIDILIQARLKHIQHLFSESNQYHGLYITENDIDNLYKKSIGEPWWAGRVNTHNNSISQDDLSGYQHDIEIRTDITLANGIELRLAQLARIYGLCRFEIDILLICMAVEIDLRYEIIYAFLHDDLTKKYPSIDLALNIISRSVELKYALYKYFSISANLIKYNIIEILDDESKAHGGMLSKIIKVNPRIVSYLLGKNELDMSLQQYVLCKTTDTNFNNLPFASHLNEFIENLANRSIHASPAVVFYLQGKTGSGRLLAAEAIAKHRKGKLLSVDMGNLYDASTENFSNLINLILKESILQNTDIFLGNFDLFVDDKKQTELLNAIASHPGVGYLSGSQPWEPKDSFLEKSYFRVEIPELTEEQRLRLWKKSLSPYRCDFHDNDLYKISSRFRFTQGQIKNAVRTAVNLAEKNDPDIKTINIDTLFESCRLNTNKKLSSLAKKIAPKYTWDDITLEDDKLAQLKELYNSIQYHSLVYNQWGFSNKLSIGKGVNVLFSGPPGTGKTMAAEILANNLGLELYKIDLSLIVSKYIGETEKNLSQIFTEAETSNAILFFDEADALFGKRTAIRDSHDRYANIEVAYLLQKMEEYDGITILATNLRNNLDEAFVRRLSIIIEFPSPKEKERKRIWTNIWPEDVPLNSDIDLDFMAAKFKLAGGYIKNIALSASFMAAAEAQEVSMRHLILSTKRELEKQSRTCVKSDFGKYSELLN